MTKPCIICVAITGSLPTKANNPAVPISVAEQVEIDPCRLRGRGEHRPLPRPQRRRDAVLGPREVCPADGGCAQALPRHDRAVLHRRTLRRRPARGGMLPLRPDMASLSVGSNNFPTRVYENPPDLVDWLAAEMLTLRRQARDRGVRSVAYLQGGTRWPRRPDRGHRSMCSSSWG